MPKKYVKRCDVTKGSFDELQKFTEEFNETNDCAVKAVAVACCVSYAEAHAALKRYGRKDRDGASQAQIGNAIREFGYRTKTEWKPLTKLRSKLIHDYNYVTKSLTTRQLTMFPGLLDEYREETWLLFTSSHVLTMKDGVLHCWGAARALRINQAVRIIKN